ncbi:hypothetical protein BX666DRAFT_1068594 [Dichotomocladium elegans]|nr:hypothetical protein BX666DRAFT_1068594 [Dichotomocladium elegans]
MILRPQSTKRPIEILLIGPAGSGKRTLAKQLLKCREVFFSINTAEKLPVNVFRSLNYLDYVLVLVDMTNKASLQTLEQTLQHATAHYLYTKCAVVITKVDLEDQWSLSEEDIAKMIHNYTPDLQRFHVNLNRAQPERCIDTVA